MDPASRGLSFIKFDVDLWIYCPGHADKLAGTVSIQGALIMDKKEDNKSHLRLRMEDGIRLNDSNHNRRMIQMGGGEWEE